MANYKNINLDDCQVNLRKFNLLRNMKGYVSKPQSVRIRKKEYEYVNGQLPSLLCVLQLFFLNSLEERNIPLTFWTGNRHSKKAAHEAETLLSALYSSSVHTDLASNEAIYMQMQAWMCGHPSQLWELLFHLIKRNLHMKATSVFINPTALSILLLYYS